MPKKTAKDYVAFFDLDHTILNNNSGRLIAARAYKEKLLSPADLVQGLLLSVFYRMHVLKAEKIMNKMTDWLKGIPEEKIRALTERVFNDGIKQAVRQKAVDEIASHQSANARSVLLSAAMDSVCAPVKEMLKMDDMICTEMEVIDGYFSGRPKGAFCYGKEKLTQARKYCENNNFSLETAFYYADSISDLALLEAVGNPLCVTPDAKLAKIALKRGWPVLQW